MPKYQIRFCDSKGHGSFRYFDADKKIEQEAADAANLYMETRLTNYPLPKTVNVWEMDMVTKEPKKKGHRFKIRKSFVQATYENGRKERKEWYEPVI